MSVTVLDREIFSEAEAARLLHVAQGTLNYWLNGGERRGRTYPPVIRSEPRDGRVVTWAELVEAGLLRGYRRDLQVPMVEIRAFVDLLRVRLRSRTHLRMRCRLSAREGSWSGMLRRRRSSMPTFA